MARVYVQYLTIYGREMSWVRIRIPNTWWIFHIYYFKNWINNENEKEDDSLL